MDGILIVDKPAGPTSHDIVALVRRLAATKRVGHGGTLDPFASGVLPIFLGRATRMLEYHLGDPKSYRATVCFGASSTTDDLEGELTPAEGPAPDRATVEAALEAFRGPIVQVPPAYSAVKVAGRRAYALARAGEVPALAPRSVTIHRLELVAWNDTDPARPVAVIEVDCSAGTYVRALARDLGRHVGSGAYLGVLVRTASGPFRLADAHSLESVRAAAAAGRDGFRPLLLRPDAGLEALPALTLTPAELEAIGQGRFVRPAGGLPAAAPGTRLRLLDGEGRLAAIAVIHDGRLAPEKVFVEAAAARSTDTTRSGNGDEVSAAHQAEDVTVEEDALVEAALLAERDPEPTLDPDPASPDDV